MVDNYRDYRQNYGDESASVAIISTSINESSSLLRSVAELVLEAYDIPYIGAGGGTMFGVDIKHLDAATCLKLSLLEEFALQQNYLREPIVNTDGQVEFVSIGALDGNISDVYHFTQTQNFLVPTTHVVVTGKKQRPSRLLREWIDLISAENGAQLWDTSDMLTNCHAPNIRKYATITYNDPHFDKTSIADNIDSIYESRNPFESVVGWAYYLDPGPTVEEGGIVKEDTTVRVSDSSSVPVLVSSETDDDVTAESGPYIGTLIRRMYKPGLNDAEYQGCFEDYGTLHQCGATTLRVQLPIELRYESVRDTIIDKFVRVSGVFFVGHELEICRSFPKTGQQAVTELSGPDNTEVHISLNNTSPQVYKIDEGIDYTVAYDYETQEICIQFVNNAPYHDGAYYGQGVPYKVVPFCALAEIGFLDENGQPTGGIESGVGTIFPKGGNTGFYVREIYAQVELDTPSVVIHDPEGYAIEIAKNITYEVAAITIDNEPAPIVIDGALVDQTDGIKDNDPTTVQDFTNTDYETKLSSMDGGNSVELTMATLSEASTISLSRLLYNWINTDAGLEINYVCGPSASPVLGGVGLAGGIVNNITYSYSDSGNYSISVTEGPRVLGGLASIAGQEHVKQTEQHSGTGIVIQDNGNGILYKVLVDGVGVKEAISGVPSMIRIGDKVNVTIYNNPVEA